MMKTKILFIAAALVGISLGATGIERAAAQSNTAGAVQGVVTDRATGEPLAGVTVVATSPALQGTASAISEADGTYKISNLPPGSYVVTFYYADITVKRTNVQVNIGKVTPTYVKIDQNQAQGEVIEIKGTPNIDTTSTSQGVTLDQNYVRNIPVPGRTFEATLGAAAGASDDALGVSFSGSTSLENQYVVDGVNTTGLTYGNIGSPVINEFIEEIEIITGGYQAEYGRSTGGVVNVVTPSGSNEFHGVVFTQFTNDFLGKDPTRIPSQATPIDAEGTLLYDASFGGALGGPIIKDKLWFFVGFSPRLAASRTERITKRMTDCRATLADGSMSDCIPEMYQDGVPDEDENGFIIFEDIPGGTRNVNSNSTTYNFVSKLNYAAAPEHQGQVSFAGTPSTAELIGVYGEHAATSYDRVVVTTDTSAKWTSKFNNNKTEVEGVVGWHRDHFKVDSVDDSVNDTARQNLIFGNLYTWGMRGHEEPATVQACNDSAADDRYPFIENCPDLGIGYRIGGPGGLADDKEQRLSARLSGTQRVKAAGTHEVKAGFDVENNLLTKPRSFSGDAFYNVLVGNTLYGGGRTDMYRWVQVAPQGDSDPRYDQVCGQLEGGMGDLRCDFLGPTPIEGNTLNWAAYLRDSWQILPNLTFNAGVRYEEQRLRYAEDLQNTRDPFTQESRGKNAMTMRNMWAPRIGLIYDWTKEGRSKVYGNYARFYESIPMDINDRSFGGETLLIRRYDQAAQCGGIDPSIGAPSGPSCPDQAGAAQGALGDDLFGSGVLVAPGIKPQYLDEFIVGSEYEVLEDLKVGLSLQRRRLGRVIEDVSVDNAATYILANPGEFPEGEEEELEQEIADLTANGDIATADRRQDQLDQYRAIRNFDKPRRDYTALQLTAVKRFSKNFFMQGSYTFSRTVGNFPGLFSADNGQVDPNISSQYDLIELLANRDGPLPQDQPHSIKLDGYYRFDFDRYGELTTGGSFRAASGVATEALADHYLYGQSESFLLPRGELGRTDVNWSLDAHLGYGRELGRGMKLEVFTDLFNLPTLFMEEGIFSIDEQYAGYIDPSHPGNANPIVGGEYEDLIWGKNLDENGGETNVPLGRNRNFRNPFFRYRPFWVQLGARLSF